VYQSNHLLPLSSDNGLKSRYYYRLSANGYYLLVSISSISSFNISHIGNIGRNIWQYYRVNIVSGTSKPDMILSGQYFKP